MTNRNRWLAPVVVAVALAACARPQRAQGQYASQVAEAVPMIEKTTGLRFKTPPRYEVRSKARSARLPRQGVQRREVGARHRGAADRAPPAAASIPDTLDLRKLMLDLLTEQVVGFYDPKTKVLYIVEGAPDEQVGFVIQHELVHALQDQYMNLDSIQNVKGDDDRVHRRAGRVRGAGDAGARCRRCWARASDMPAGIGTGSANGSASSKRRCRCSRARREFLQEQLIFPYINGMEFMREFNAQRPGQVPYGKDLPASSAQIMHPAEYFASPREMPITVTLPAPRAGTIDVRQRDG